MKAEVSITVLPSPTMRRDPSKSVTPPAVVEPPSVCEEHAAAKSRLPTTQEKCLRFTTPISTSSESHRGCGKVMSQNLL